MKKAVILTLERTSRRRYLSGGGLRVLGLRWVLQNIGYDVSCLQPSEGPDLEPWEKSFKIHEIRADGFMEHNMNEVLSSLSCDLLVVEQWGLLDELDCPDYPVVVDLHGSLLFENEARRYSTPQQMRTKILSLSKCDAIITPGKRQQYYYLGWAKMAGILTENPNILQLPLFLPPEIYSHCNQLDRDDVMVMGGARWPWADVDLTNELRNHFGSLGFTIETQLYSPQVSQLHPECIETIELNSTSNDTPKSHVDLIDYYSTASLAWDFYPTSWERQLAITTRTVEYLYCGLVPIYRRDLELSDLMTDLDMGICLREPHDIFEIRDLRSRLQQCRQNIFKNFPECWNHQHHFKTFKCFLESIVPKSEKTDSVVLNLERDYRNLRRQVGEISAERDHLRNELLRVEQELIESRETKDRWKRLWRRDL